MKDDKTDAPGQKESPPATKKLYTTPRLTVHGEVVGLTRDGGSAPI